MNGPQTPGPVTTLADCATQCNHHPVWRAPTQHPPGASVPGPTLCHPSQNNPCLTRHPPLLPGTSHKSTRLSGHRGVQTPRRTSLSTTTTLRARRGGNTRGATTPQCLIFTPCCTESNTACATGGVRQNYRRARAAVQHTWCHTGCTHLLTLSHGPFAVSPPPTHATQPSTLRRPPIPHKAAMLHPPIRCHATSACLQYHPSMIQLPNCCARVETCICCALDAQHRLLATVRATHGSTPRAQLRLWPGTAQPAHRASPAGLLQLLAARLACLPGGGRLVLTAARHVGHECSPRNLHAHSNKQHEKKQEAGVARFARKRGMGCLAHPHPPAREREQHADQR